MWGFGGRQYWGRKDRGEVEGIVVVFAWMSSQPRHVKNYVDLYSSLGWNSLVCHSQFLNSFYPEKAAALALEVLNELVEELRVRPCPVVIASFSGGPKACMYKLLQIIDGKCEEYSNLGCEYSLVRDCVAGHIFDSCPVDFTSDLGTRFLLHPTVLKISSPPPPITWIANQSASIVDALFLRRFEEQRANYWQTLYASISLGVPYLILCSEDDDLAPFATIHNFAQRLKDLGGDVNLVTWSSSPHVGHYRHYPEEYKAAVAEVLSKSCSVYSGRAFQLKSVKMTMEHTRGEKSSLRNASHQSGPLTLGLVEDFEGRDLLSVPYEGDEQSVSNIPALPRMNAHGVLGQILFDVCVPKNVEGWDIMSNGQRRSRLTMDRIKCIRRSRL
ncbi:unnamed protein product [Cuscuta epithymum]|uniref:DUF829 domain-containing protein n=1 Tax=Cuscuta epithymum TaxID=186058 RepID=A0AAV0E1R3_9ASTE|nr:unnamed protein product [Cuscuta epithymum]